MSSPKPRSISRDELLLLKRGKKLPASGTLVFEDINRSCQSLVDLKCFYCVSKAEIDPVSIDIGKVGHSNSWKDVQFSFTLRNMSDVPYCFSFDLPEALYVEMGPKKIAPMSSLTVAASLAPKLLGEKSAGSYSLNILVNNSHNRYNVLKLDVGIVLSVMELKVERLENGELILPPLDYPLLLENPGSDTW